MRRVPLEVKSLMKPEDESLRTSWTLVARMKNLDDEKSWDQFHELYRKLVIGVAKKAGLRDDEAEDVLQETMRSVCKNIGEFKADPAFGSFRAWLLNLVRWRIKDQLKRRLPVSDPSVSSQASPEGTATTPTVERVPNVQEVDLEGLGDAEWERLVMQRAIEELQLQVKAEHYQIFHLLHVERKPIVDVARMVGRNRAQIYLMKHRVTNALKRILKRLDKELG